MLENTFLTMLNMSFTSSIVILFVLLFRLLLKKTPKVFSYALWSVVLFRLICPFSFESVLSFLPTKATRLPSNIVYQAVPKIDTGTTIINNATLPAPIVEESFNSLQIWTFAGAILWLCGIAVLLVFSIISLLRFKKRLSDAVYDSGDFYLSARIDTPFVMGVIRPKIYIPAALSSTEKEYILLHEQTHICRLDHIVKILSFFVLCVHWFNPLVWVAFFLSGKDMEMSCDETVIKKLGSKVKKDYSTSLLSLATGKRIVGGTPLAFGEGDTKCRIKNVLNYKKPSFWVVVLSLLLVIGFSIGLVTNPTQMNAPTSPFEIGSAKELWNARTQYIGDNSAVGKIIYALNYPDSLIYDSFELRTSEHPYAVTLKFKADTETRNYYTGSLHEAPFQMNACILFSLIENVEYITFSLDDGVSEPYSMQYTSDWAEDIVGANLWEESKTLSKFEKLLVRIDEHVSNAFGQVKEVTSLQQAVSNAILEQNSNQHQQSDFTCESHVTLGTEVTSPADPADNEERIEKVTVYAMVLYQEYNFTEEGLNDTGGSHIPTALTFDVNDSGDYTLKEYWIPRDGSYYALDIENKFPQKIKADALDTQKFILVQIQNCYAQAIAYGKVDTNNVIEGLFHTIMSSPKHSSSPNDYIEAHKIEHRELTYYGDYTLRYCFAKFLKGGQTGLKGQMMRIVMDELIGSNGMEIPTNNGQEYFDAWLNHGKNKLSSIGIDAMRERYPKFYLLLNMMED